MDRVVRLLPWGSEQYQEHHAADQHDADPVPCRPANSWNPPSKAASTCRMVSAASGTGRVARRLSLAAAGFWQGTWRLV